MLIKALIYSQPFCTQYSTAISAVLSEPTILHKASYNKKIKMQF